MRISNVSTKSCLLMLCCTAIGSLVSPARAVSSAELYTSASFPYGRFEARVQFAGGDGVVGSFFLWKDASEMSDVFWNELDLETVWGNCELFSNALYGLPEANHTQSHGIDGSWCTGFHTYAYEWTPDYTAWFVDGVEVRRDTGEHNAAFRDNADAMQIHFNVWPGDSTFGGNFSPAILPLFEYINWVQYSSYADGVFTPEWREDFSGDSLPEGWSTGTWDSPKGLSTHSPDNVAFIDGYAVLSLTADDAIGSAGAAPMDPEGAGPIAEPEPEPEEPVDQTPDTPDEPESEPVDPTSPVGTEPAPDTMPEQPVSDPAPGGTDATPPGDTPSGDPQPGVTPGTETGDTAPAMPGAPAGPAPTQEALPGAPVGTPAQPADPAPAMVPVEGTAPEGTAPMAAESSGGSDGGCRMNRGEPSSPWAWLGLLVGLVAPLVRRRASR